MWHIWSLVQQSRNLGFVMSKWRFLFYTNKFQLPYLIYFHDFPSLFTSKTKLTSSTTIIMLGAIFFNIWNKLLRRQKRSAFKKKKKGKKNLKRGGTNSFLQRLKHPEQKEVQTGILHHLKTNSLTMASDISVLQKDTTAHIVTPRLQAKLSINILRGQSQVTLDFWTL